MMLNPKSGSPAIGVGDLFQRNEDREHLPALWAFWFNLRVLTLCGKEFDFDLEAQSDAILNDLQTAQRDVALSILKREVLSDRVSEGF